MWSGFFKVDAVPMALGVPAGQPRIASQLASSSENPLGATPPAAKSGQPAAGMDASATGTAKVHALRSLMQDYFSGTGKQTGSDNRADIARVVKMFEDLCPRVKTLG